MTQFKEGDEVLVRGVIDTLYRKEDKAAIEVGQDSIWYIEELNEIIPVSALDVNKELLAENERLRNNQSILITSFRINMMRLRPDYSHEEFDKDIADMLKEKE